VGREGGRGKGGGPLLASPATAGTPPPPLPPPSPPPPHNTHPTHPTHASIHACMQNQALNQLSSQQPSHTPWRPHPQAGSPAATQWPLHQPATPLTHPSSHQHPATPLYRCPAAPPLQHPTLAPADGSGTAAGQYPIHPSIHPSSQAVRQSASQPTPPTQHPRPHPQPPPIHMHATGPATTTASAAGGALGRHCQVAAASAPTPLCTCQHLVAPW
jgi:hypothetical protein